MQSHIKSLQVYSNWIAGIGVCQETGRRWNKRGWVNTLTIAGRRYISSEAIAEFIRRSEAGDFKEVSSPGPLQPSVAE